MVPYHTSPFVYICICTIGRVYGLGTTYNSSKYGGAEQSTIVYRQYLCMYVTIVQATIVKSPNYNTLPFL